MTFLSRWWIWMRRIGHCRGFGIQSANDYWLVRYVINEHWPYYQYDCIGKHDDWLTKKLGRLYLRLANWRQPRVVVDAGASPYWLAGCRQAEVISQSDGHIELMLLRAGQPGCRQAAEQALRMADERSVLVIEHLWRDKQLWKDIMAEQRVRVTFDLYYCGIALFDSKRAKQNYIVNF